MEIRASVFHVEQLWCTERTRRAIAVGPCAATFTRKNVRRGPTERLVFHTGVEAAIGADRMGQQRGLRDERERGAAVTA